MLQPSDMQTWLHCSDTNLDSEKALFQASIASIEKVENRLAPIVSIWHLPSVSWWLLVVSILPAAAAGAPAIPMAGGKRGPASRVNKMAKGLVKFDQELGQSRTNIGRKSWRTSQNAQNSCSTAPLHRRFSWHFLSFNLKIWDFGSQHKPSSPTIARRECCSSAWNWTPTAGHWPKKWIISDGKTWQRTPPIGLRENLQESPIFNGKIYGFRFRFSLKPINWSNVQWKLRGKLWHPQQYMVPRKDDFSTAQLKMFSPKMGKQNVLPKADVNQSVSSF